MTLLEALKVSRGACVKLAFHLEEIGADEGSIAEIEEAAAVLARLEEELPKLANETLSWPHVEGCEGQCLGCVLEENVLKLNGRQGRSFLREGFQRQYDALLSRLDAAPKEGS